MVHKILSKDRVKTNKNVERERERERGREMKREREMGKRGGREKEREREREREGGEGEGNVYILCSFCHNVSRKWRGGSSEETNSGMETAEIHIKTIQLGKELNRFYNSTYRTISPTSRLVPSAAMNLHGHCKCPCQSKSS